MLLKIGFVWLVKVLPAFKYSLQIKDIIDFSPKIKLQYELEESIIEFIKS